ncbi:MarR family winged helix-turn-helix transcriptional regulator [Aquidulcibacter paucihalophilus]|uniref:MarR family winged helix-turn-helix transcriptional regulator n=1 Tax=Aquidulcibacter paucihalophilus TaxID=1978549 RepID=UPI000A1939D2|nr:MarR family winged helix-turn-helix transcriptional regulator [Aquidulcibacter paucihalophilus]
MTVNTLPNAFARSSSPAAGGPRLYLREDELDLGVALIFKSADLLKIATDEQRQRHQITWVEARCLCELLSHPLPVLKLAAEIGLGKQTMLKTLDGLEGRAWLQRTEDPHDGRRRIVQLTAQGTNIATELALAMRTRLAAAYRLAGSEAVAGCDKVLSTLTETPVVAVGAPSPSQPKRAP